MFKVGDKVEHMGMCYRITRIADGIANIQILRKSGGPRCRKVHATAPVASLKPWKAGA